MSTPLAGSIVDAETLTRAEEPELRRLQIANSLLFTVGKTSVVLWRFGTCISYYEGSLSHRPAVYPGVEDLTLMPGSTVKLGRLVMAQNCNESHQVLPVEDGVPNLADYVLSFRHMVQSLTQGGGLVINGRDWQHSTNMSQNDQSYNL